MKIIIFLVCLLGLTLQAKAGALDTDQNAVIQMKKIQAGVFSFPCVNMMGISGCNPTTGLLTDDFKTDFVHCIMIGVEDKASWTSLKGIYPTGTQINKVFIDIVIAGGAEPL